MERNTFLQWHYGTVKWRPRVDGRWNCCSEMFILDYWWIVSLCNTHRYVWKYMLYSYMKGFDQVRFNFNDIWQRVNFDAQCVSEQTGKLSGGPRVFDLRVRQIFRARLQSQLLMSPGHLHPWYQLYQINLCSKRINFNYLHHLSVEKS